MYCILPTSNLAVVVAPLTSLHHLCCRNQVTHFLISAPFVATNTLLQSHSLLTHPNKSLLEHAGPRLSIAGMTSNRPFSLLPKPPPSATCACFHCRATKGIWLFYSLRVSAFVPRPAILEFGLPDPTYIHSLLPSLEFTLFQLPIVLLKYCPVISTHHLASKTLILFTLRSNNHFIANNTLFRLASTQPSHLAIISIIIFIKFINIYT